MPTARKLKCDGGRPACHQCLKRTNHCDYMPPQKRRGGVRQRRQFGSDSDPGSGDEPSVEMEPSQSPEVLAKPLTHVNSAPEKLGTMDSIHPAQSGMKDHRGDVPKLPPLQQSK